MPKVIAEATEILVIDKPAGLIVHRDGRTEEPSVAEWVLKEYPELAEVGESWISPQGESVPCPGIVHRLDRTTSGVMLIAKTQEMYQYLKKEFKERRVEKVYRAFVYGHVEERSGKIIGEITRSSTPPKRWFSKPCEEAHVRAAITEWTLLGHLNDPQTGAPVSYVEIVPKTGRTHQIRVHLASIGHPIVSDHLYASDRKQVLGFLRPALHAHSISLTLKHKKETFVAPLPEDFQNVVTQVIGQS